jgi:heavy metal translocating P-type ATPase
MKHNQTIRSSTVQQLLPLCTALAALTIGLTLQVLGKEELSKEIFYYGLILGSIGVLFEVGLDFSRGKWGADLLAVLAVLVSIILGEYIAGLVIVLMVSSGEMLEELATKRASSGLAALAQRVPLDAIQRGPTGTLTRVPVESLVLNDQIVIPPHGISPTDGIVLEGHSVMDEAYLTGEPISIPKAPGSIVLSGALNGENALVVTVTKKSKDSRYAQIVKVIEETSQVKLPLRRLGDRLGALFTPLVLVVAFISWWASGDMNRFLAVLVVATPCPLILSIPVAILGSISVAARQGILIRQAGILETLPLCKTLILDKTGTLTMGQPQLTNIVLLEEIDEAEVLSIVGSLEQYSRHPLAKAITKRAQELNIPFRPVHSASESPGEGLKGIVDEREITIGGRGLAKAQGLKINDAIRGLECLVWFDEKPVAHFIFRDTPRPESKTFISHLDGKHDFSKIMIVSGDRASEVAHTAEVLGIKEIRAEVSPEGKLEIVREEMEKASVVFIGDGINDAPALIESTVGIALGKENDVTGSAADAVILKPSLHEVDTLFHLAFRTRRIILQSVGLGMLASIAAMIVASLGYLTPTAGAIIQQVIDVLSLGNALRTSFKSKETKDF